MSIEAPKNSERRDQEICNRIELVRLTEVVSEDLLPRTIKWQDRGTPGEEDGESLLQQLDILKM